MRLLLWYITFLVVHVQHFDFFLGIAIFWAYVVVSWGQFVVEIRPNELPNIIVTPKILLQCYYITNIRPKRTFRNPLLSSLLKCCICNVF